MTISVYDDAPALRRIMRDQKAYIAELEAEVRRLRAGQSAPKPAVLIENANPVFSYRRSDGSTAYGQRPAGFGPGKKSA